LIYRESTYSSFVDVVIVRPMPAETNDQVWLHYLSAE